MLKNKDKKGEETQLTDRALHEVALGDERDAKFYIEQMRKAETSNDLQYFYNLLNCKIFELKHATAEILRRQANKES